MQASWASVRGVGTLAKGVFRNAIEFIGATLGDVITVSWAMVMNAVDSMIKGRGIQSKQVSSSAPQLIGSLTLRQQKPPGPQLQHPKVATSQFQQQMEMSRPWMIQIPNSGLERQMLVTRLSFKTQGSATRYGINCKGTHM